MEEKKSQPHKAGLAARDRSRWHRLRTIVFTTKPEKRGKACDPSRSMKRPNLRMERKFKSRCH